MPDLMLTLFAFVFALLLLVSVHEWGHYRMALALDVKVLRFSIGWGRPVLRWRASDPQGRQDTEMTIGWLPIGGYVSLLDESQGPVELAQRHRAFNRQSLSSRTLIVAAGPAANLLLAVFLFAVSAWWGQSEPLAILSTPVASSAAEKAGLLGGELVTAAALVQPGESLSPEVSSAIASYKDLHQVALEAGSSAKDLVLEVRNAQAPADSARWVRLSLETTQSPSAVDQWSPMLVWGFQGPRAPAIIGRIEPDSPAARGGLHVGDKVLRANGRIVADAQFIHQSIRASVDAGIAQALDIEVDRGGQVMTLALHPLVVLQDGIWVGRIGAVVGSTPASIWVDHGLLDSLYLGFHKVVSLTRFTIQTLSGLVTGQGSLDQLGGPLAIADQAGRSAHHGWTAYLGFLGFLSVSLGLLNLLPLPLLDGGHLMYYLWELLTGKPVSSRWVELSQKVGLMLLLGLMATTLVNDGMRLWR